jgi:hypothetical protein
MPELTLRGTNHLARCFIGDHSSGEKEAQ